MRETVGFAAVDTLPEPGPVLRAQGIPAGTSAPEHIQELLRSALAIYLRLARPRGVLQRVSGGLFQKVYEGEGRNASATPLDEIALRAERLALFAATIGKWLSDEINELFATNELALAAMLDAVASEGAERLVGLVGRHFVDSAATQPRSTVLAYSPGYCGWHVSGQGRLFRELAPVEIGITLNSSYLMEPLKSVSGVLVAGPPEIHDFDDSFDFCGECATRECRGRIAMVMGG
jgi:hypothetical protein